MSSIVVGTAGKRDLKIRIDELMTTRLLIQANSGGGKSWLLRRLAEQLFGKVPVIIIDPEGEFATLREKYDFVLVGQGGDTPAHVRSAGLLAETLLKLRACAVCDLYETFRKTPIERHQWVKEFLGGLLDAPKSLWGETIVIVDEAHMFCPEQGESPAEGVMVGLATAGRKRGFCPIWATQRLALVDKSATSQLQNRMVGLTFEDVDVKRATELLSVAKEDQAEFKKQVKLLEPGDFFAFGRAISKERVLVRVGAVETSHPKMGRAARAAEPPPPPEKIKALLPKLADLPKTAEEQVRTAAELKKEIRELKAQLRIQPNSRIHETVKVADPRAVERAVRPLNAALEEAMRVLVRVNAIGFDGTALKSEEIEKALAATAKEISRLAKAGLERRAREFEELKRQTNGLLLKMKKVLGDENLNVDVKVQHNEPFTIQPAIARSPARPRTAPLAVDGTLSRPQQKILLALAEFEAIGVREPSRSMVASWCGVKAGTGSFKNYLSELRVRGLLQDGAGHRVSLTEEGRSQAPSVEAAATTEELLKRSELIFGSTTAKILRLVHSAYPEFIAREAIAEQLGISADTGSFKNYISELRTAGIIVDGPNRAVKAADWLFID